MQTAKRSSKSEAIEQKQSDRTEAKRSSRSKASEQKQSDQAEAKGAGTPSSGDKDAIEKRRSQVTTSLGRVGSSASAMPSGSAAATPANLRASAAVATAAL